MQYILPSKICLKQFVIVITVILAQLSISYTDVIGTNGHIRFDVQSDGQFEMLLDSNGLGVLTTPSANLHVNGNAIVSQQLLVGGATGNSNLHITGSIGYELQSVSSNTSSLSQAIILADSSSDNITITLPYAGNVNGEVYVIKKMSALNSVYVKGNGNLIDDMSLVELSGSNPELPSMEVISNGQQWYILNKNNSSSTVGGANLVGWWKFDETSGTVASDSSNNGYSGSLMGGFSFSGNTVAGVHGTALDFDGVDDYINIEGAMEANFVSNEPYTISVWVKQDDQSSRMSVVSRFNSAVSGRYYLDVSSVAKLLLGREAAPWNYASTVSVPSATWTHLVYLFDGSDLKGYIDTTEVINEAWGSISASPTSANLQIGAQDSSYVPTRFFDGAIDDVRIYNRNLTEDEINLIYSEGQ